MEKLQAGIFSGQTKPLRSVGIDVTYQSIDNLLETNEELSKLGVTSKKLTQDQKVLARTILVAQAAMNAWGDSAKTINSLANQVKVFQGSVQNLALAVGDMISPIATQFLTMLNGIVMAMTTVIRLFVSMVKKVPYEVKDMKESVADEYADLEEETGKLLSFDKFEALNSSEDANTNATLALTAQLQKTIAEYQAKQNETLEEMENKAIKVRNAIMGFLGYEWDEEANDFVKINHNLEIMGVALSFLAGAGLWKWLNSVGKIQQLKNAFTLLSGGTLTAAQEMTRLQKATSMLRTVGFIALIAQILDLISKWGELDNGQKLVRISLIVLTAIMLTAGKSASTLRGVLDTLISKVLHLPETFAKIGKAIKSLNWNFSALWATLGLVAVAIVGIVQNWGDMNSLQRVISIVGALTTAVFGLALATGTLKAISAPWKIAGMIAGMALVTGAVMSAQNGIKGYATGGTPERGEIFQMNEYGRPEAFIKSGGHTSVINDVTMGRFVEQGFEEAIRRTGLVEAVRESRANVTIQGDAQQIFKVVDKEGRRVTGKGWTNR